MKVLVIQPKIGMGDMVIYLPYIHAISKKHESPVSLLVKDNSRAGEILEEDKHIGEIISLDRTKNNLGNHDGIFGLFRLSKKIKNKNYDKVFIFSSSIRYLLIAKLAKIKNIYQYPLFLKKDNIVYSAKTFVEKELNQKVSTQPILNISENKNQEKFSKEFKHLCIGLSASGPTKRWDVKKYIDLCEKLNKNFPCKFYLAAGKNDSELVDRFFKSKIGKNCVSFDKLKIKQTMPIIKNCDLYIGNDTGWLHISAALGLNCLALFMDSPVMAYGKYSKNIFVVVPDGETEKTTTHDTLGAEKISFEKVYNEAIKLLL
ncbi:glycosyltransferase family 9 protein [Pelagibacteraceae bacterium]|nr:glycosyltransferase family 9 protein [Pelagibacteraceae bacterium]